MSIPGPGIEAYRDVAPRGAVDFLLHLSERVRGRHFVHVNSTRVGGGVAEILRRLVPLMNEVGAKADWEIIEGDRDFFAVTKAFHNALQGEEQVFTEAMLEHYLASNRANASRMSLNGDLVLIHDPQPAALVESRPADGQWVWRCHIDLASPQRRAWSFLRRFVLRYDAAVFSLPAFAQQLAIPQFLVYPSIDPLADKNRELEPSEIDALLAPLGIPRERPIVLQVSRFDRFKDPIGSSTPTAW
jgi:trehalose synthase